MNETTTIYHGTRDIHSAWSADGTCGASVGSDDVLRIVPYEENGQMAPVIWLAVYKNGHHEPAARLNGAFMAEIRYAD